MGPEILSVSKQELFMAVPKNFQPLTKRSQQISWTRIWLPKMTISTANILDKF